MSVPAADVSRPQDRRDLTSLLSSAPPAVVEVPSFAWGFGGLHGGVALSLAASAARETFPDLTLRSITGHFHQPIRETLAMESRVIRSGRTTGAVHVTGLGAAGLCLSATAIFGLDQAEAAPTYAPKAPEVPGPDSLRSMEGLADKVPVLGQVDVRPIGSIEPYAGAAEPTMTAWMRLKGSKLPADSYSVIFFLDALPPSYTAVLTQTDQRPVPTLEFSAHLASSEPISPWVLVQSRTVRASPGGWVTESIDAWGLDGAHLGSAQQLRIAMTARSSPGA